MNTLSTRECSRSLVKECDQGSIYVEWHKEVRSGSTGRVISVCLYVTVLGLRFKWNVLFLKPELETATELSQRDKNLRAETQTTHNYRKSTEAELEYAFII